MTQIYAHLKQALESFCTASGIAFRSEFVNQNDAGTPSKYILAQVISDNDIGWYDNRPKRRKYRIQIDLAVPEKDKGNLITLFDAMERAMIVGGFRPIGSFRMAYSETTQLAYIQKDYFGWEGSDNRWA